MRQAFSLLLGAGLLCFASSLGPVAAEDPPASVEEPPLVPAERSPGQPLEAQVVGPLPVIGPEPAVALRTVPGSGSSLTREEMHRLREPVSAQDVVQTLPGVTIRGEVASGIIPNIGVRGLNPDRSEKLLILE